MLSHIATVRGNIQLDMFKLADKLASSTNGDDTCTPVRAPITGHHLNLSPYEGNTSTSKRPRTIQCDQPQPESVAHHIIRQVTLFAKGNLKAISKSYINLPNGGSTTVFGERRVEHLGRKYVFRPGFQTGPWS
ncbi:hypothetical protein VPH35_016219 [Triticum aestivum]